MRNISKQEARVTPDLPGQARQQPPDLRFCRAWWEFKKALYPKLGNAALRVFLVIEDRASRWNNYHVPMSLATLGEETGVKHHTTLAAGIRELEAAKIITVTRHLGNSRQANIYALLIRELIGDGQEVLSNRSDSGSNSGGKCDCAGNCQIVADNADNADKDKKDSSVSVSQGSVNHAQLNSEVNYTINSNSTVKVTTNARICNNRNSHAISAAASANATSAKTDIYFAAESSSANSGSAKTDSVLSCTNSNKTNRINWFNPDGLNGVTAEIQPVKTKSGQSQNLPQHATQPPNQPGLVNSVARLGKIQTQNTPVPVTQRQGEPGKQSSNSGALLAANSVQPQDCGAFAANFEAKAYRYTYQPRNQTKGNNNHNSRQWQEEYFKRLSWATSTRERMAVLFSALRLATGNEPGKAEFSGVQALVNEYGCKAVLAGILVTVGRDLDRLTYFAYLRGIIRNQAQQPYITNFQSSQKRQLPIDLGKYTGNGKYAHLVTTNN